MSKYIFLVLVFILQGCSKDFNQKVNPVATTELKEIDTWRQRLYQDSCIFEMVYNDPLRKRDAEAMPILQQAYDKYMFSLVKNKEYIREKIKELERKQ